MEKLGGVVAVTAWSYATIVQVCMQWSREFQ